jgi:tRNA A-37 threonylcarbamoyl transferase component Bud32
LQYSIVVAGDVSLKTATTATRESAEHAANVVRAKRFAIPGLVVWMSSLPLALAAGRHFGHTLDLVTLSSFGTVVIGSMFLRIHFGKTPSPFGLRFLMSGSFAVLNVVFALLGSLTGALMSPYSGGGLVVLAAFGIVVTLRWRQGLVWAAPVALAYPITTLVVAWATPSLRAQLADQLAFVTFQFDVSNVLALYAIVVVAGHLQWSLRRQIFEARSLGRYRLKRQIGAGGMGEVWIAYHDGLKRDVAVKILRDEAGDEAGRAVARFEREVRATAELTHPNTVRVYDFGVTDDGLCYYAMELLDGESLATLAAHAAPLPPARAIHLVGQAARALAEAHARGIVHRDVKPENLLVTTAGGERDFVKVLDFGIAKHVGKADATATLTRVGSVVGTPRWMAPEAFFTLSPVEATADVYGLGAVLYLLLTGRAPIAEESLPQIVAAHTQGTIAALPASVPRDLAAVVERCLRKAPEERYLNAGALAEALAACADAGRWTSEDARGASAKAVPSETENQVDVLGATEVITAKPR